MPGAYYMKITRHDKQHHQQLIGEEGELFATHMGGAAVMEGVMMRGKYNWAVAVRCPDGSIYTEAHDLPKRVHARIRTWPLVRGCCALIESMALSFKAMSISAQYAFDLREDDDKKDGTSRLNEHGSTSSDVYGEDQPSQTCSSNSSQEQGLPNKAQPSSQTTNAHTHLTNHSKSASNRPQPTGLERHGMNIALAVGVLLGLSLFIVLPALLTNLIVGPYDDHVIVWNIVDGVWRALIFVIYMVLIAQMPDMKRLFAYHGAEHKTIHCFEHGYDLTPSNAQKFSTQHVRCGTSFLVMTIIISVLVFILFPIKGILTLAGITHGALRLAIIIASRIILIPLIAGISYEITVKWAGKRPDHPLVRLSLWPGLQMQKLTTNPPTDEMIECAIEATKLVIAREEQADKQEERPAQYALAPCAQPG